MMSCFTEAFSKQNVCWKNYTTFVIDSVLNNRKPSDKFMFLDLKEIEHVDSVSKEKMLVEATLEDDFDIVMALLNAGVSVEAEQYKRFLFYASKSYMTPLQIAAALGNWQCLQHLVHKGADVNAKDRFEVTATHMAAEQGYYRCLKILLDAGADCSSPTKNPTKSYKTPPFWGGTTPLHLAAANNHINCVKELIHFGADYNAVDDKGRTGLFIASQAGYEACVMVQLKNAVGRDILSLPGFETGDTPLHFAVRQDKRKSH